MRTIAASTTTVITGASSGIGRAFAHRLAAAGSDLVLVARRADVLDELARELRSRHGVTVTVIAHDLDQTDAAQNLVARLDAEHITVDALINNAGLGIHGDLGVSPLRSATTQIAVNVNSLTVLTALVLPGMLARGRGAIINVASTAGFQPVPHMAVYSASKAYVLAFTRALWRETRRTGVDALALCPGATDTAFFATAGDAASVGRRRTAEQVVDTALRALRRGRPSVVDGRGNAAVSWLAPRLPERLALSIAERSVRP
ncbi:SDR family NAD(P)-dependent oxidoreductase [Microbacterium testaceum]|uniref:SDR family NAD(P)-dependent oxidoreductase n=1 Tax=Microbacterium enclense TaxID=993073 RepID=UPI0021C13597|nr:SDR family oxidoreductase [Microbacterium testaceum]